MDLKLFLLIPVVVAILSLIPFPLAFIRSATLTGGLICLGLAAEISREVISSSGPVYSGSWLFCDGLGAIIILLVAFVGVTASIFSWGYIKDSTSPKGVLQVRRYYTLFNLFLFSMYAIPLLRHLGLIWVAVEMTTLMSAFLVGFGDTPKALEAAWKYVILTCMGAAVALFGILLLYWARRLSGPGPFTWQGLISSPTPMSPAIVRIAFILILVGLGTKVGLVPLHTWLPDAHSQAPSPVCALLSGVETTTVLYIILRLIPILSRLPSVHSDTWFMGAGLLSAGVAAFLLLQVRDYKRLFAFSTIEHMGIILFAAGLYGTEAGFGTMYQVISHAMTKSFCFLAAGTVLTAVGTRKIDSVRGLARAAPVAGAALIFGALAIAGAPPFAVFIGEFSIIRAGLSTGHFIATGLLAAFIVLAFCGIMTRVNRMVFGKPDENDGKGPKTLPVSNLAALIIAGIPVILLGLYVPEPIQKLIGLAASAIWR